MFGFGYRKLRKKIEQFECEIKTGHKKIIFVEIRFPGFSPVNEAPYKFRCARCGLVIYKTEEQLTIIERNYLDSIDMLHYWPLPPECKPPKMEGMRLRCNSCGKSVSTEVPCDTVVRAWLECPECIEKRMEKG